MLEQDKFLSATAVRNRAEPCEALGLCFISLKKLPVVDGLPSGVRVAHSKDLEVLVISKILQPNVA